MNEQKRLVSEVFLWRARFLFGLLLSKLCEDAELSQHSLARKAKAYRKDLRERKYLYSEKSAGAVDQSAISRIINVARPPNYSQVYIWLTVIHNHLESEQYHRKCDKEGKEPYHLMEELKTDIYRLALLGTPEEIFETYKKHNHLIDENSHEFQAAYRQHLELLEKN